MGPGMIHEVVVIQVHFRPHNTPSNPRHSTMAKVEVLASPEEKAWKGQSETIEMSRNESHPFWISDCTAGKSCRSHAQHTVHIMCISCASADSSPVNSRNGNEYACKKMHADHGSLRGSTFPDSLYCHSMRFITLHYQIQTDNMHKPSLRRVLAYLAILWDHGTFREHTLSSLDILATGISEDLFQVYQGNANCCARNHRSADGHHLECDKHRVSETLAGMYGMMLVQGMRLRGSSLYNEDEQKQSFSEPRPRHGMFQHFLFRVLILLMCLNISEIERQDVWMGG